MTQLPSDSAPSLGPDELLTALQLSTVQGEPFQLPETGMEVLVLDFWSAECPISRQYDPYFNGFARSYGHKGVVFVAIDSNVYEDESLILRAIEERDITFPILRDLGNRLADRLGAETTPHLFVFDRGGHLRYRGAVDDITFQNKVATTNFLEEAVDALLLGQEVARPESPPYGCTIVRAFA